MIAFLRYRRIFIVAVHLVLCVVSYTLAYLVRFGGLVPGDHLATALRALPWLLVLRALSFWAFRLYAGLWRYVSIWDLNNIILGVLTSSLAFAVVVVQVLTLVPYARSVFFIDALFLIFLLGGIRLARRTFREFERFDREKRILIYGAGDAGEMIVRDMKNNQFYNREPVGFIDDDLLKAGRFIRGVPVLGTRNQLQAIVEREKPDEILIAIARIDSSALRSIVKLLQPFTVPIKTLPNLRDVFDGRVQMSQARSLSLADLMTRSPVNLDPEPVRRLVNGRRVLVTGAGGSIGSELSRQLIEFGPARLLLLERYETALFELCNDLDRLHPGQSYEAVIADIGDAARIDQIFSELRPDVVFHAAAHKHVPLMELNVTEAIKNNVRGTRTVAESSLRFGTSDFVLISTDKAVSPSSVMGASKRVAELLIRSLNRHRRTRFVAVRFGNVLGSNGSVTPLFADQIDRGGPVTVTHPEMRRYFMLIPEAVQLVLHAAAMRDDDAIYALEMGEPIRIQDLARNLIRLSGYVPDEEIAIHYVGLRPGEKLSEQLIEDDESSERSAVHQVMRVRSQAVDHERLAAQISALEQAADQGRPAEILRLLCEVVPSFTQAVPKAAAEPKVLRIQK